LSKSGGLISVIATARATAFPGTGGHYTPSMPEGSLTAGSFGLSLVSALWAYDGYADLSYTSGEVRDPERNMPRALIGGTVAVITIYLLANIAYLAVISVDEMRRSPLVAADVAERVLGSPGVIFVSVTVMLSTWGTLTSSLFTSPRIFFAMAEDGLFFRPVARVSRWGTPWVAISINIVLGVIFVLVRNFEQLADAFVTAILPFYALGVASLFVVRRRAGYAPKFRTPGYPVVPALFVASALYLLGNALVDSASRGPTALTLGIVLLGIPVFYFTVGKRSRPG
jgi:amino acid transporter